MNKKFYEFLFVFHATDENKNIIINKLNKTNIDNVEVIYDKKIKKRYY